MKKNYEKPAVRKAEKLQAVAAGFIGPNGSICIPTSMGKTCLGDNGSKLV